MAVHSTISQTLLPLALFSLLLLACGTQAAPKSKQGHVMNSLPLGSAQVVNQCGFEVQSNIVHSPRPGDEGRPEEVSQVIGAGESVEHPFLHDPGMGLSWKLWPQGAPQPVQFEWTWTPEQGRSYWDLSMIDAGSKVKRSLTARQEPEWEGEGEQEHQPPTSEEQGDEPTAADPAAPPAVPAAPAADGGIAHPFAQYGMTLQPMTGDEEVQAGNCVPVACPAGATGCAAAYNYPEDWSRQHDCPEGTSLRLTLCG